MPTRDDRPYVWLSMVEGLGPRRMMRLLTLCGDAQAIMGMDVSDWSEAVGRRLAADMRDARPRVDDIMEKLDSDGIRVVTRENPEYPPYLREVYDPPIALFVKGDMSIDQEYMIGMVGSRRCTRYGLDAARMLAKGLAEAGVCVISGLARGIDTASHLGALAGNGATIAVLGCGHDVIYPPENAKLYAQIADKGALVTEYLPGSPPLAAHFPLRNRIISGMSHGVVLVEAARGSGAMITVDYALEHGREIFAVPGNITSSQSAETNRLIYEGKCLVRDARDILFGMGWADVEEKKPQSRAYVQLTDEDSLILEAVADEELSFEELANATGFEVSRLNSLLTTLVMRGIMKQSPGRIFSVNRDS